ncbi:MAG: DUF4145 domain-containing protein [Clostridia bacterium]|nr:DUF4145 domain-containing protein [Clostridia bacterium]
MQLGKYVEKTNLSQKNEITKVKLIAFFQCTSKQENLFCLKEVTDILMSIGYPISNYSRLKGYLAKSKDFRKLADGKYVLTGTAQQVLRAEYGDLFIDEDLIDSNNEVLDESLFCGKRGFLDKLIKQINHCYQSNCYDACAVCMRRVFEITLILAYENLGIQDEIKNNGEYVMLEKIVANAVNNSTLGLSRLKKEYNSIREVGNYAAHRVLYNTRKKDIDDIKNVFRVCLEELYYKAGMLK